jgi:hypothetical protein
MFPPHSQNTVGACNKITVLILYCISSRLVTLLKNDTPIEVSHIFDLTVIFKFINVSFEIFLYLFLNCLLASRLTLFRLSTLLWLDPVTTAF